MSERTSEKPADPAWMVRFLYVHGYLSEAERDRAYRRIAKRAAGPSVPTEE